MVGQCSKVVILEIFLPEASDTLNEDGLHTLSRLGSSAAYLGKHAHASDGLDSGRPEADNQPQCSQCAYRPFCAVPASVHLKRQGTTWGQLPSSSACAVNMGILDHIISTLNDEKMLLLLDKWHVDMT